MKTIEEFITHLHQLDVKVWVENDSLRYKATKETLTPSLLAEMRERKSEILTALHQPRTSTSDQPDSVADVRSSKPSIEKVSRLSYSDFESRYLSPLHPVVITDAIQNWTALSKWTPEFIQENFGTKEVTVDSKRCRLQDFMGLVLNSSEESPAPYLRDTSIPEVFPELIPDIQPDLIYSQFNRLQSALLCMPGINPVKQRHAFLELLIAGQGTKFPVLHFDYWHLHAFIMQIYGDKEFILYPPEQTEYLYPQHKSSNLSLIKDIRHPDLHSFPLVAKATPLKVIVKAGETIFVPSGWWHSTRMLTPSIAVTFNSLTASNWKLFSQDIAQDFINLMLASSGNPQDIPVHVETDVLKYLEGLGVFLDSLERMKVKTQTWTSSAG